MTCQPGFTHACSTTVRCTNEVGSARCERPTPGRHHCKEGADVENFTHAQQVAAAIDAERRQFQALDDALLAVADAIAPLLHIGGDFDGDYAERRLREILDECYPQREEQRRESSARFVDPYPKRKQLGRRITRLVMERDEYRCLHCGTHKDLTIDHIVAVVNGGTDEIDNLQTLCRPCNSRKGTR